MCTGVRESVRIGTECVRKGTTSVAAIVYCILYQHSPVWVLEIENGTVVVRENGGVVREEVVERQTKPGRGGVGCRRRPIGPWLC